MNRLEVVEGDLGSLKKEHSNGETKRKTSRQTGRHVGRQTYPERDRDRQGEGTE